MSQPPRASAGSTALAVVPPRVVSHSAPTPRSVAFARKPAWRPPDDYLRPEQAQRLIAAAACERDRLLLRVLWATGCRISEALALRAQDVHRDALDLPNRKNASRPYKTVVLPAGQLDLPGALLLWQREANLAPGAPLFFSRKRGPDGGLRALGRQMAYRIVVAAGAQAGIELKAVRDSPFARKGDPRPPSPHALRHARVRHTLRVTKSLPIVQEQAGWARLQQAYLRPDLDEIRAAMAQVAE